MEQWAERWRLSVMWMSQYATVSNWKNKVIQFGHLALWVQQNHFKAQWCRYCWHCKGPAELIGEEGANNCTSLELWIKDVWNIPHLGFTSSSNLAQGIFGKYRFDKWNINNLFSFLVAKYIFVVNLERWQKRKSTI